jgi:hypothetical protein
MGGGTPPLVGLRMMGEMGVVRIRVLALLYGVIVILHFGTPVFHKIAAVMFEAISLIGFGLR